MLHYAILLNILLWFAWLGFMIASQFEWNISTARMAEVYEMVEDVSFFVCFISIAATGLIAGMTKLGSSSPQVGVFWRRTLVVIFWLSFVLMPVNALLIPKRAIGHSASSDILLKENGEWVVANESARRIIRMNLRHQAGFFVIWWSTATSVVVLSLTSEKLQERIRNQGRNRRKGKQ